MKYIILGICLMITSGCTNDIVKKIQLHACFDGVVNAQHRAFLMLEDEFKGAVDYCIQKYGDK